MATNAINFAIGGVTLTYQPSAIQEIYPDVSVHNTLSGSRVVIESNAAPIVELTFGVQAARNEVIGELRNKRSASGSVSISYLDATGTSTTRTVYMPKVNYEQFLKVNMIQPLTFQFYTL